MDSLVSTDWLARHLGMPGLVVLDASKHLPDAGRDAAGEFAKAHVPGARFLDMPNLHDAGAAIANAMPGAEQVAAHMARLGVSPADRIVLYDDSRIRSAARAWFILREHGFGSLAILDGGLAKWVAEARPLESGTFAARPAERAHLPAARRVFHRDDMMQVLGKGDRQIVDARDADRFCGPEEGGGHIPGSRNLWFADLFEEDGTYRSPSQLRALFGDAGIHPARPIVTTCNSGMTAAVLLFALHLIGAQDTALYDGSWSEWGAHPDTPKATGAAAGS